MITEIKDLPDGVVGFKATGQITHEDYNTIVTPAVKGAFEKHEKVSLYYEIDMGYTGFDLGAGWDDLSLGVNYMTRWERVAFVTDISWMSQMTKAFSFLMPAMVQTYSIADKDKAIVWLKGEG